MENSDSMESRESISRLLDGQPASHYITMLTKLNKASVNMISDGIQRDPQKGFLVIEPQADKNNHLALKVEGKDKYWTISVSEDGKSLTFGIWEKGKEEEAVFSLNEDGKLKLNQPLVLSDGVYHSVEENVHLKGISSSGFKGFVEGTLFPSSDWKVIPHVIRKKSFGKYRLQAWLISERNRYAHLESTFVFFPDGTIRQHKSWWENALDRYALMREEKKRRKAYIKALKKVDKESRKLGEIYQDIIGQHISSESGVSDVSRGDSFWNLFKTGVSRSNLEKRVFSIKNFKGDLSKIEQADSEDRIIAIRTQHNTSGTIYYSLERLWEGEHWVENTNKANR